jgi:hypothetical protein
MKAAALIGALSISLYTIFLFSCSFTPVQTHHVIFEEIREMAGALLYIHVVIPINISSFFSCSFTPAQTHHVVLEEIREMAGALLYIHFVIPINISSFFSCSFTPAQTHHVVFEEIREMAGALLYIHVVIPINISRLLHAIDDFHGKVVALKTKYTNKAKYANRLDKYGGPNTNDLAKHVLFHFC